MSNQNSHTSNLVESLKP